MKKIKSVLYNIYSPDPYPFQLREEYERLINPLMEQVNILNYSCHIHLDVGQYAFSDNFAMRGMVRYVALDYDDDEDVVEGLVDVSLGIKLTF